MKIYVQGWNEISFEEIVALVQGRKIVGKGDALGAGRQGGEYWELDDGTRIAATSSWSGPYSEYTPDTDAEPPKWYVWAGAWGRAVTP